MVNVLEARSRFGVPTCRTKEKKLLKDLNLRKVQYLWEINCSTLGILGAMAAQDAERRHTPLGIPFGNLCLQKRTQIVQVDGNAAQGFPNAKGPCQGQAARKHLPPSDTACGPLGLDPNKNPTLEREPFCNGTARHQTKYCNTSGARCRGTPSETKSHHKAWRNVEMLRWDENKSAAHNLH